MTDMEPMDTTADGSDQQQPPQLAARKEEWGDDISPEDDVGKVFKSVLVEGHGETRPGIGDEVYVHYTGRLLDGTVFDTSIERNELFKFKLGEGKVIKGWDTGVATMRRGEKSILTCSPDYAYGSSGSPSKIPPNATLQFEVELFKWSGDDVIGDGGVMKSIVVKGDGFPTPNDGALVTVMMKGCYDDKVIEERELEFSLGEGSEVGVIEGVEIALAKMKKGEMAAVEISSKYGYGDSGRGNVPPHATLQYTITLRDFEKAKSSYEYSTIDDRVTASKELKDRGTIYFKAGKILLALKLYTRATALVENAYDEEDKVKVKDVRVLLHLNKAACSLKLKDASATMKDCDIVLELDSASVKGHFRKGQAHMLAHDYDAAESCFQEVLLLEPANKAAVGQQKACARKLKEEEQRERRMYKNIFAKLSSTRDDEEEEKEVVEERVKVMGGPQGGEEEEGPVKDIIAEAAEQEEAAVEV